MIYFIINFSLQITEQKSFSEQKQDQQNIKDQNLEQQNSNTNNSQINNQNNVQDSGYLNQAQLKTALQEALQYCKLSRYDYIINNRDIDNIQKHFDHAIRRQLHNQKAESFSQISIELCQSFAQSLVQDSFTECFQTPKKRHFYQTPLLFILYILGIIIRYCILLPLRFTYFFVTVVIFSIITLIIKLLPIPRKIKNNITFVMFHICAKCIAQSVTTIINLHGKLPKHEPGMIYVSNHSSTFDYAILSSLRPFSVIGQRHKGIMGFIEDTICQPVGPLFFERKDRKDCEKVKHFIKERTFSDKYNTGLLVFPEGVCVNNKFTVQFKKGAFDIGATVVPIAMKYSELSPAAYFNSKEKTFLQYMIGLWTQWADIVDIYILAPEKQRQDETSIEFAHRIQLEISDAAGLIPRQWDGMLKYLQVNDKMINAQQRSYAKRLNLELQDEDNEEYSVSFSGSTTTNVSYQDYLKNKKFE